MTSPSSLDTLCAALCYVLGIKPPKQAATNCGSYGLDMDEDLNSTLFYKILPKADV